MQFINRLLNQGRSLVQQIMRQLARLLNYLSGGHLHPNVVTLFGLAMHIPIALLIAHGYLLYGAAGLVIFGLFDALDGQLARLQSRSSAYGMLLDSVTDRIKEVLIYIGIGYFLVWSGQSYWAIWAVAGVGLGLLVSYCNAWGEVVTKDLPQKQVNKAFRGGLMSFDIRMFCLVIGLATNHIALLLAIIVALASLTVLDRLQRIKRLLVNAKN